MSDMFEFVAENGRVGSAVMSYLPYVPAYPEDKDVEIVNGLLTGEAGFLGKHYFPIGMESRVLHLVI